MNPGTQGALATCYTIMTVLHIDSLFQLCKISHVKQVIA